MIRVVARNMDEADSILIGDFPPSEIDQLVAVLKSTRAFISAEVDDGHLVDRQFVPATVGGERLVLELLFE